MVCLIAELAFDLDALSIIDNRIQILLTDG